MMNKPKTNEVLLKKILTWDLSDIITYVITEHPEIDDKDIKSSELEYKYFIYLTQQTDQNLTYPTKIVDLIWHAHILHTVDYVNFCNHIAGEYIHHQPEPHDQEKYEKSIEQISDYSKKVFGNVVFDFNKKDLVKTVNYTSFNVRVHKQQ